jgi:hypothetical protein
MYYYLVYGLNVQSNIEFPQLFKNEEGQGKAVDLFIEVRTGNELKEKYFDPANPDANSGPTQDGIWFFNQAGTFLLEHRDGISYMTCEKYEGTPDSVARSFLLGNCIAVIMTFRKNIVLHGSTVVLGDKTVLVCGDSGTGKSTTAMALLDAGGQLLSDDISVLDVDPAYGLVYSLPGFPEQKLCRDAAVDNGFNVEELTYIDEDRDKFSVDRRDIFLTEKKKVDALVSLHLTSKNKAEDDEAFENGVRFIRIDGGEKVNAITDRFFLDWLYGHGFVLAPTEMMKCIKLAGQIDIIDVTRVRDMDTREYLVDRLLKEIKG